MSNSRIISAEKIVDALPFRLSRLGRDASDPPLVGNADFDLGREHGLRDGFAKGREEGYRAGLAHARQIRADQTAAACDDLVGRANEIADRFDASLSAVETSLSDRVLTLALRVAAKVVGTHVDVRPDAFLHAIGTTLAELAADSRRVSIRVNPEDHDALAGGFERLRRERDIEVIADAAIGPGGCIIDSKHAQVDATLSTRWRRVLASIGREDILLDADATDRESSTHE